MSEREPVLCLVKYGSLWFTTQALEEQWGDDWDDAPYEYNCGMPSSFGKYEAQQGKAPWTIVELKWEGPFETPADLAGLNSRYSVRDINSRAIPWLQTDRFGTAGSPGAVKLWAGMELAEVGRGILEGGGMVYAPVDGSAERWLAGKGGGR